MPHTNNHADPLKISTRVDRMQPSATLAITALAKSMRAQGIDVLAMSAGEPDFETPEHIRAAAQAAIERGDRKYTPVPGTMALRQAVAKAYPYADGKPRDATDVQVCAGGKQVLFNACATLLDPNDEVLFGAPYWVSYPDMVRFADAIPKPIACDESSGFLPKAADIAQALTDKTRMLILNSPGNPSGAMYTPQELEDIAALLRKHPQIFIITDDIYSALTYDTPFCNLPMVAPDLEARTLIATGVSKAYAMTGWRIGFGIGPKPVIAAMNKLQGASTSGASCIAQAAALAAVAGTQEPVEKMRAAFAKRRNRVVEGLRQIPGVQLQHPPQGAFYAFPNVQAHLKGKTPTTAALCTHLLESAHVALVPGEAFGAPNNVRLSFACSEEDIDEGLARIRRGLESLT